MKVADRGAAPMKNVFLDAGGVILDEASLETARADPRYFERVRVGILGLMEVL